MTPARDRSLFPWLAALLIGLLPWAYGPWPTRGGAQEFRWPLLAVGIFGCAGAYLFESRGSSGKRSSLHRDPLAIAAAMIVFGLVLSSIFSAAPRLGFKVGLRETVFAGWMILIARRGWTEREAAIPLAACVLTCTAEATLTLWQRFAPGSAPWTASGASGRSAMSGTLGNPEYVAGLIACGLAAAVAVAVARQWNRTVRIAALLAAAPMAVSIVLGGGRGAALGVMAALGLLALLRLSIQDSEPTRMSNRKRLAAFAAVLAIFGLGFMAAIRLGGGADAHRQSLGGRFMEMFDPRSVSTRDRLGLWSITSGMIVRNPMVGCGPGLFGAEFDRARGAMAKADPTVAAWNFNEAMNDHNAPEAHCDPMQWWAEYGLLPFMGLMLSCSCAFASAFANRAWLMRSALGPWLAALTALFASSFLSFPLHRPERALIFWTALGVIHGLAREAAHSSTQTDPPRTSTL